MNDRQKTVLLLAAVAFALMGICPPFLKTAVARSRPDVQPLVTAGEYGLLFAPPAAISYDDWSISYRIDTARLLVQWAVLGAATAALMLALRPPAQRSEPPPAGRSPTTAPAPSAALPRPPDPPPPTSEAIRGSRP